MIRVGDTVRIRAGKYGWEGGPSAVYRVKSVNAAAETASVYGGKPNRERFREVPVDKLVKRRKAERRG